jgi:hypothetical protein
MECLLLQLLHLLLGLRLQGEGLRGGTRGQEEVV